MLVEGDKGVYYAESHARARSRRYRAMDMNTSDLTPGYFDFQAGSSARRGAALAAGAVAAVRAVFDLRRSRQV